MANAQPAAIAVDASELSSTPQSPEPQQTAQPAQPTAASTQAIPVDASELQSEHEFQMTQPPSQTPATTPLSAKPIPASTPEPMRKRAEFERKSAPNLTTEGVGTANEVAGGAAALGVAGYGAGLMATSLFAKGTKEVATGLLDEAGKAITKVVETPSQIEQIGARLSTIAKAKGTVLSFEGGGIIEKLLEAGVGLSTIRSAFGLFQHEK